MTTINEVVLKYVTDRQTHVRQAAVLSELAGSSMKRSVTGCKHNYLLITYTFFFLRHGLVRIMKIRLSNGDLLSCGILRSADW